MTCSFFPRSLICFLCVVTINSTVRCGLEYSIFPLPFTWWGYSFISLRPWTDLRVRYVILLVNVRERFGSDRV